MNKTTKTIISLALASILSLFSFSAVFAEGSPLMGDVNSDGVVNADDYIRLKRAYFGSAILNLTEQMAGDMNGNGEIDADDYIELKRVCFGNVKDNGNTAPDGSEGVASEDELKALAYEALRLMNIEREKAGVAPLVFAEEIYECAKTRANEATTTWSHTRPDGSGFRTVYDEVGFDWTKYWTGENLAGKFRTVSRAIDGLMNSEGHRKNILFEEYDSVAIGVVETENGYYMAQLFLG